MSEPRSQHQRRTRGESSQADLVPPQPLVSTHQRRRRSATDSHDGREGFSGPSYTITLPQDHNIIPGQSPGHGDSGNKPIGYRTVFLDDVGPLHTSQSNRPSSLLKEVHKHHPTAFDVVTEYSCSPGQFATLGSGSPDLSTSPRAMEVASLRGKRRLDIFSPAILHALRVVVQYWPDLALASECLTLHEPFSVLVHHMDALADYRQAFAEPVFSEPCIETLHTYDHLGLLLDYIERETMPGVLEERERHKRQCATFEYLWLLFKPGSDVVVTVNDQSSRSFAPYLRGYVVEGIDMPSSTNIYREDHSGMTIRLWGLDSDGSTVGIVASEHHIEPYDGEIEVKRLQVLPAVWPWHGAADDSVKKMLEDNGGEAYDLLTPQCKQHTGKSTHFPYNDLEGLVMVDSKTWYADNTSDRPRLMRQPYQGLGVTGCHCSSCSSRPPREKNIFTGYNNIDAPTEKLTAHQSFLFPTRVRAFHFQTRTWHLVDVSNLKEPEFEPKILDTLVMKQERIEMIKALSQKFVRHDDDRKQAQREFWSADFIKGKGRSQVILLHGKPGVGKTYTAECIAVYTRRPLMTLTCADIGTDPEEVEENLASNFAAAKNWGALVLIDEADIYMEVSV